MLQEDVLTLEETVELPAPELERQTRVLLGFLSNLWGPDQLVLRAGKLEALSLLRSERLTDRLVALQRLVYEDPTIDAEDGLSPDELLLDLEDRSRIWWPCARWRKAWIERSPPRWRNVIATI